MLQELRYNPSPSLDLFLARLQPLPFYWHRRCSETTYDPEALPDSDYLSLLRYLSFFSVLDKSHCQMLGKVEYGLPAKI